jgi:hypothetical protein
MEASRAKSGSMPPGTSATGRITRRTALAFSSTRMETSMKACGKETSATAKEPTGGTKVASLEENTPAIGSRIRNTVEALSSIRMAIAMTVTGWLACPREKVV